MQYKHYKVVAGDTLGAIAARNNVDVDTLARLNGVQDKNLIYVGQTLKIPSQQPTSSQMLGANQNSAPSAPGLGSICSNSAATGLGPLFSPVDPLLMTMPCGLPYTPPCCVTEVQVGCQHAKRSFKLKVPDPSLQREGRYQIQLLAGQADVDTLEVSLQGGPCVKGKPIGQGNGKKIAGAGDANGRVPQVTLSGSDMTLQGLPPFKVDLAGPESKTGYDLEQFLETLLAFDPDSAAKKYRGAVTCCDGGGEFDFTVDVYPSVSWSGEITLSYEFGQSTEVVQYSNAASKAKDEPLITKTAKIYTADDEGKFSIGGGIRGSYGAQTFEVKLPSFERKGQASTGPGAKAFSGFKHFFEKVLPQMHVMFSNELVSIEPLWPKVTFGGDIKLVESQDDFDVYRSGSIYLKCDPLIGLKGSTDILDWLILACMSSLASPAAANWLIKIKTKAEKGVGNQVVGGKAVIAINFSAAGKVHGGIEWRFLKDQDECLGGLGSNLSFQLEGVAEIEIRFFFVSATAGASISAETGMGGSIEARVYGKDPGLQGQFIFDGLIIKAMVYGAVGGSSTGLGKPGGSKPMLGNKLNTDGAGVKDSQSTFPPIELIAPAKWPSDSAGAATKLKVGA